MVTSEAVPFYKTGGLADMVTSLSKALKKRGNNVRVFLPLYNFKGINFKTEFIGETSIRINDKDEWITFSKAEDENLTFYFLSHPIFSDRSGVYGENNLSYEDSLLRQMILVKSIKPLLSYVHFDADVIHSHDWMTALVPYYYKNEYKTVFTIHNIAYMGKTSVYDAVLAGLKVDDSLLENGEDVRMINPLKAGILNASVITTVSPTYAKEILTPLYSEGLDPYLTKRKDDLYGILNGVDETVWNPKTDKYLLEKDATFSLKNLKGKKNAKKVAKELFGFDKNDNRPLIGIISRLAKQKGFYECLSGGDNSPLIETIKNNDALFAIIGTGDKELEDTFTYLSNTYENVSYKKEFSESLSHILEAGSDFFFMPSRYEPCGLNQMYSLLYGSLPIVNKTGGLADTVIDIGEGKKANGFVINDLSANSIKNSLKTAISCYNSNMEQYKALQKNAMNSSFSWENGAKEYEELYKKLHGGKR